MKYQKIMDQEEFERYESEREFSSKEPVEPFSPDEMLEPEKSFSSPSLDNIHVPQEPLTKDKLQAFLIELLPIVEEIQSLSRKDQHYLAKILQDSKNLIHAADFNEDVIVTFEKLTGHFNDLLTHSTPLDQDGAIHAIKKLQSML